jgi:hypothetical protein
LTAAAWIARTSAAVEAKEPVRRPGDFYQTPPEPTRALLRAEGGRLRQFPLLWEPACGDGAMMREILAAGHACVGTDIRDRGAEGVQLGDFFGFAAPLARAIVTNPPYTAVNWRDGKGRWITHALEHLGVEYMALLLSWNWAGAAGLGDLWERLPPARVYLCRWKIDFTGDGAPPMLNGWFVWDRAATGPTRLLMLDRVRA